MRSKLYLPKVYQQDKLLSVQINVTNKCPCKCSMCNKYKWPQIQLSQMAFNNRLTQYNDIDSIVLSGGEPFMYPYLEDIMNYKPHFGAFTTGIGGKYLENTKLIKKFDWIRISVDGFKDVHDFIRGVNIYSKAIEFAKICRDLGVSTRLQFTIQKTNVHEFCDFVSHSVFSDNLEVFGFFVQGTDELEDYHKSELLEGLFKLSTNSTLVKHSNIIELIEQLTTDPYTSNKCIIPKFHRVIDADNTEWPCCYTMADNLPFEKRDLKYECSQSVHSDLIDKHPEVCKTCDKIFSRYQRINEEYEQYQNALKRPVFL